MANVALFSLHRYFRWAEAMKGHHDSRDYPPLDQRRAHSEPYLAYWLGGLYVVIEGWKDQGFSDPTIDDLLTDEKRVDLLRRYRNGAFHYCSWGRLECRAFDEGARIGYRFTGQGSYAELLPGKLSTLVATPAGFARSWSRELHGELEAVG
jgi:hypothetical protein